MGFKETFARAVQVADEGWGQAERRHQDISSVVEKLRGDADSAATFLNDGEVPPLYSIIRNPQLADALRLIQEQGEMRSTRDLLPMRSSRRCRQTGAL